MSHLQLASVLLALLIAYGVVGRMDYEGALAAEPPNGEVHLLCVRYPLAPSGGRSAQPSRGFVRRAAFTTGVEPVESFWRDVLYCVNVGET